MKRSIIFLCNFIFVFLILLLISAADANDGKEYLNISEDYMQYAEFDKALKYCERAISFYQSITNKTEEDVFSLARAYYLKANILVAKQATDKEISNELENALLTNHAYKPPELLTNLPKIKKLLTKAKEQYKKRIEIKCQDAIRYFVEGLHCKVLETLKGVALTCPNPETTITMVKKSKEKCNKPEPDETDKKITKIVVDHGISSKTDVKPKKKLGIFPVIYKDYYENDKLKSVKRVTTQEKLFTLLINETSKIEFLIVDKNKGELLKKECSFQDYSDFIVSKGAIKIGGLKSFEDIEELLLEQKMPEIAYDSLPKTDFNVLKKIAKNLELDFLSFLLIDNQEYVEDMPFIKMILNIYEKDNSKPIINYDWELFDMDLVNKQNIKIQIKKLFLRYINK